MTEEKDIMTVEEELMDRLKIISGEITRIKESIGNIYLWQVEIKKALEQIYNAIIAGNHLTQTMINRINVLIETMTRNKEIKQTNSIAKINPASFNEEGWEDITELLPKDIAKEKREAFKAFCKSTNKLDYYFDRKSKKWYIRGDKNLIKAAKALL